MATVSPFEVSVAMTTDPVQPTTLYLCRSAARHFKSPSPLQTSAAGPSKNWGRKQRLTLIWNFVDVFQLFFHLSVYLHILFTPSKSAAYFVLEFSSSLYLKCVTWRLLHSKVPTGLPIFYFPVTLETEITIPGRY